MQLFKIAQNWNAIELNKVTVIPRDASIIKEIIDSLGGTRFMLGYIKKDGSWRVFHAQRHVHKDVGTPEGEEKMREIREEHGMINVYDVDVANRAAQEVNKVVARFEAEGKIVDPEKLRIYKDKQLNQAQRNIYPDKIEMIKGRGQVWLVEDATNPEVRKLVEQKQQEAQKPVIEEPAPILEDIPVE